jgi:ABC-type glycerol-3-phosphate transport system substrate-binding protein
MKFRFIILALVLVFLLAACDKPVPIYTGKLISATYHSGWNPIWELKFEDGTVTITSFMPQNGMWEVGKKYTKYQSTINIIWQKEAT